MFCFIFIHSTRDDWQERRHRLENKSFENSRLRDRTDGQYIWCTMLKVFLKAHIYRAEPPSHTTQLTHILQIRKKYLNEVLNFPNHLTIFWLIFCWTFIPIHWNPRCIPNSLIIDNLKVPIFHLYKIRTWKLCSCPFG